MSHRRRHVKENISRDKREKINRKLHRPEQQIVSMMIHKVSHSQNSEFAIIIQNIFGKIKTSIKYCTCNGQA